MSPAVASFVSFLRSYNPSDDASPIATLYPVVALIENEESAPEAFDEIFAFFERYPDADLGAPGPLVHLIEGHVGKYEDMLATSLKKKPSAATVEMANRILNAHRSTEEEAKLMGLLAGIASDTSASDYVRGQAQHYHEYQKKG